MYDAFAAGDEAVYRGSFAPQILWHVPGGNPVSGAYRGLDEYFGLMPKRMAPLDRWEIIPPQSHRWFGGSRLR